MDFYSRRWAPGLATVMCLLTFGLVLGACGGDDGGDGNNAGAASTQGTSVGGSDEQQIRDAYASFSKSIKAGDGKTACSLMTGKAQQQIGIVVKPLRSCPQGVKALSRRINEATSASLAKITRVALNGDEARLSLRVPGAPPNSMIMRKEGGSWKAHDVFVGLKAPSGAN